MLGSYLLAATQENWLHDSLVTMIKTIHDKQDASQKVPAWGKLIPNTLSAEQISILKSLRGIKGGLQKYESAVATLSIADRATVFQVLTDQNNIVGMLAGTTPISSLQLSFPAVHAAAHDLFVFAYGKLTDLGVRDRQYKLIFNSLGKNVCIFCGVERIMSPQEARQDLDHYLPKSIYPFAAANMRNLVPMCRCCNRDYKHDVDTLKDINGKRRKAYDPYNAPTTDISLQNSIPFDGTGGTLPAWAVDFDPASDEAETWDQVFCIRMRYSRDVLNHGFNRWIGSFMTRCKQASYSPDLTNDEVLQVLKEHHKNTILENPVGLDFLKPKVFEMLIFHYEAANERVIKYVRDAVIGIQLA